MIKLILKLILGLIVGLGLWYLLLAFLTNELNMLHWHWGVKLIYIFFGLTSTQSILNELN